MRSPTAGQTMRGTRSSAKGGRGTRDGGYWVEFADERFRHLNEHLPSLPGEYAKREIERHRFDLALGHRRLSILDLSHLGHQPMSSSDRLYWTVFNGEIYNFPELKRELQAKGRVFRTTSDTEVLLQLWEEEGTDSVERLNGMFAFALYDRTAGKLFLVRDRFGVKPLYFADTGAYLVFASEPKGVLASGLLEPRLDPASLAEYMTFQNLFGDRVIFGGMRLLPPGCLVEVDVGAKERRMRELRYAQRPGERKRRAKPSRRRRTQCSTPSKARSSDSSSATYPSVRISRGGWTRAPSSPWPRASFPGSRPSRAASTSRT